MREKKILTTNFFCKIYYFSEIIELNMRGGGGGGESIITELIPCAIKINTI